MQLDLPGWVYELIENWDCKVLCAGRRSAVDVRSWQSLMLTRITGLICRWLKLTQLTQ
jgi:hypothetical protein